MRSPLLPQCNRSAVLRGVLWAIRTSRQSLAPNIGRALDLDQHADTRVRPDMRLLPRQEQLEDGLTNGPTLVQLGLSVEPQKAGIENAVALRLEVGVDHANALVVAEVFERLLL